MVGADVGGQGQGFLALSTAITDAGVSSPQDLERHVAETAGADDHRGRAGHEQRSERLTAWYGVSPASVSGAASTGSRSPSGTRCRALGTSMWAPSPRRVRARPRRRPISAWRSQ